MPVTVNYIVHNPHVAENAIKAVVKGGIETVAKVDMLEVELVARDDREHGTLKLRFFQNVDAMKTAFPNDKMIAVTFADPVDDPNPPQV